MIQDPQAVQTVDEIVAFLTACQQLPRKSTLSSIEAGIVRSGQITVVAGENYANRALKHLITVHLPDNGDAP